MNETLRNSPARGALPGQTQDDQSIPILTERLTLPPLDLDTTLPDFAPAPVSLQLPPAPLSGADDGANDLVAVAATDASAQAFAAGVGEDGLADADRSEFMSAVNPDSESPAGRFVSSNEFAFPPIEAPEIPAELQDDAAFAVHLEFAPAAPTPVAAAPSSSAAIRHAATLTAPAAVPYVSAPVVSKAPVPAPESGAHWTRIEIELRESILAELTRRLPQEVEQIVREQIEPAFADIVNRLAIEARMAIAASLREIIERAVKAELDTLRARRR